jgi:hypothetical protein
MREEISGLWDRQTGRPFNTSIAKYEGNTKMGETSKSKIEEHAWNENHRIR